MTPETHRRWTDDDSASESASERDSTFSSRSGHANDKVLTEVYRANDLGITITIWDLPQVTGLALHEAFAAVRRLEADRLIDIDDNPSDPFGATLHVKDTASDHLGKLHAR